MEKPKQPVSYDERVAQYRAWQQGRKSPVAVIGYSSKTMDAFTARYAKCEALFAKAYKVTTDPETGIVLSRKTPTKAEKVALKAAVVQLVAELEQLCPRQLIERISPNKDVLEGANLSTHLHTLDSLRQVLEGDALTQALAEAPEGKPLTRREQDTVRRVLRTVLRGQSDIETKELVGRIRSWREGVKPTRQRVWSLSDVDPEGDIPFAQGFVKAVQNDQVRGELPYLPALDRVALKTRCFLAMIEYSHEVKEIAKEMWAHPQALWEAQPKDLAQRLDQASQAFRDAIPRSARSTPKPVLIFREQDGIIHQAANELRRASDNDQVRACIYRINVAAEHLNNLALTYLKGGPAEQKIWLELGEKRIDESLDIPKLLTRVSNAYVYDRQFNSERLKDYDQRTRRHRISESVEEIKNPIRSQSATMDYVYAARWALAAQKIENLIKDHAATLADPTIDTEPSALPKMPEGDIKAPTKPVRHVKRPERKPEEGSGLHVDMLKAGGELNKGRGGRH